MQSLFPQRGASSQGRSSNVILSFSAGKCQMLPQAGGKYLITPEPRRGTLSLEKDGDGLIHFVWADRTTGVREEDKIVFPDEIVFKKAKTGRPDDRVYYLRYLSSTQYYFFWMQDKSGDKDSENCSKINEYINNPASADAALAASAAAAAATTSATGGRGGAMNGQDNWLQMMGLGGMPGLDPSLLGLPQATSSTGATIPSNTAAQSAPTAGNTTNNATTTSGAAAAGAGNPFASLDISSILNQLNAAATATNGSTNHARTGSTATGGNLTADVNIDLSILQDENVTSRILPHMPSGQRTTDQLRQTLNGPPFRTIYASIRSSSSSTFQSQEEVIRDIITSLNRLYPPSSTTSSDDTMQE